MNVTSPPPSISNVVPGTECLLLANMAKTHHVVLHIAVDDMQVKRAYDGLRFFHPDIQVLRFPAWDCIPYDRISPSPAIIQQRIECLVTLLNSANDRPTVILSTINAASQYVVPKSILEGSSYQLTVGSEIRREELTHFLVENGYHHIGAATDSGEFSARGSIVDIVPSGSDTGLRLDFFGDILESIRMFDPLTQISTPISGEKRDSFQLIPASEVMLNDETIPTFRDRYRDAFGTLLQDDPLYESISEGRRYAGMEHWLPCFYPQLDTFMDYLPPHAVIACDHLVEEARHERLGLIDDSYEAREHANNSLGQHYRPLLPKALYLDDDAWKKQVTQAFSVVDLTSFKRPDDQSKALAYEPATNFAKQSVEQSTPLWEVVREAIKPQVIKGQGKRKLKPLIACISEGSRSRVAAMLDEHDLPYILVDDWQTDSQSLGKGGLIGLGILPADHGFIAEGVHVITEQDLFGEKIVQIRSKRKRRTENFLKEASNLNAGEYVVHKQHGIGRFMGLETVEVQQHKHDFLLLHYLGDDKLYVPVEHIDVINRYGGEEAEVTLDKLGGVSWQRRTAEAKQNVLAIAKDLMGLAAKRETRKGTIFTVSESAYGEFASRFPFSETDDQLRAIEDVFDDLGKGKPMDRLICGDVGFGKTEVALRAAFIVTHANEGGAQVAIVAPTTLLCRQHFETFSKRFAGTGITVKQLSRFVSTKEQNHTKQLMAEGKVDIVVGTHALLSKDVTFQELGLVIVDEEQRFGVKQKERLKHLRANSHILTLSATPIPRTLQLSMSGIRDLSLIATPPVDRLAVRTYVMPYDPVVIREAIMREHFRGGRTFYVCPRVSDVEEVVTLLEELVPEVKVIAAHGRMTPEELDEIMQGFYDGVYHVLVATTIIESGLDIPSANNLVVHRADMFGLAQLYQIRGRVGRAKLRAYAYLTLPPRKKPTQQAMKRLEVMQKLDHLGAGFTLASHDMDIRGFGNLLGEEQSGNVREVGVELYQDFLREAIEGLKDDPEEQALVDRNYTPKINLGLSVLIPDNYVADLGVRMGLYRRIAELSDIAEVESMAAELVDRFGPLPQEVTHLLDTVSVKQLCYQAGIAKLDAGEKAVSLTFHNNQFANPEALLQRAIQSGEAIKLKPDQSIVIKADILWVSPLLRLKGVKDAIGMLLAMLENK